MAPAQTQKAPTHPGLPDASDEEHDESITAELPVAQRAAAAVGGAVEEQPALVAAREVFERCAEDASAARGELVAARYKRDEVLARHTDAALLAQDAKRAIERSRSAVEAYVVKRPPQAGSGGGQGGSANLGAVGGAQSAAAAAEDEEERGPTDDDDDDDDDDDEEEEEEAGGGGRGRSGGCSWGGGGGSDDEEEEEEEEDGSTLTGSAAHAPMTTPVTRTTRATMRTMTR